MKKITIWLFFIAIASVAQNTYVPDDNFEQYLLDQGYDSGALDNYVPTANITNIATLQLYGKGITDLTGIEDFKGLAILRISDANAYINTLDISKNTGLEYLSISYSNLNAIDLSKNTQLIDISFSYCPNLKTIDVSNNTQLTKFYTYRMPIKTIDTSNNSNLHELNLIYTPIENLDISTNNNLKKLNLI